jgi:hypothetical protein
MTDGQARTLIVRLAMLRGGHWQLDGYADDRSPNMPEHVTARVDAGQTLVLHMAAAGGYAARLSPVESRR